MAKCKFCGQNISRLDREVCPFCGGKNPLDGADTSTQDITKVLGQVIDSDKIKHHSKVVAAILSFFLGIFGVNFFYLKKNKIGLVALAISCVLIGGLGSLLCFTGLKVWGYLIPFFALELICIFIGVGYLTRHDVTDGNGEFLD